MDERQKTLNAKLRGNYQYYGRPTNYRSVRKFHRELCQLSLLTDPTVQDYRSRFLNQV